MRRALVIAGTLTMAVGCQDPTQITVELFTDVPCATVERNEVTLAVGVLGEGLEQKDPVATTGACAAGAPSRVGSLVVVPGGEDDAEIGVKVVLGVNEGAQRCEAPEYRGCVVSRRALRFIPHTPLHLPITLRASCENQACNPFETCVKGVCRPALIEDLDPCTKSSGCGEEVLEGGSTSAGAGGAGGSGGAGGAGSTSGAGGAGGMGGAGGAGGAPMPTWVLLETLTVPATTAPVNSTNVLQAGVIYRLRAIGTYVTNPTNVWEADAEYYNFAAPTDFADAIDAGLAIDDPVLDGVRTIHWGPYRQDHTYEADYTGQGTTLRAQVHDSVIANNSGSLTLEIYALQ